MITCLAVAEVEFRCHAGSEGWKRACGRQMFANHKLAFAAAEMEVHEAKGRLAAQNQLAAAEAQVCKTFFQLTPLGRLPVTLAKKDCCVRASVQCGAHMTRTRLQVLSAADTPAVVGAADGVLYATHTRPLTAVPAAALLPC